MIHQTRLLGVLIVDLYSYHWYLVWLDVLDERGFAAVVQPDHEDAHIPTEATHGRSDLLEQPHDGLVNSSSKPLELRNGKLKASRGSLGRREG